MDTEIRDVIRGYDVRDESSWRRAIVAFSRAGRDITELPVPVCKPIVATKRIFETLIMEGVSVWTWGDIRAWSAIDCILRVCKLDYSIYYREIIRAWGWHVGYKTPIDRVICTEEVSEQDSNMAATSIALSHPLTPIFVKPEGDEKVIVTGGATRYAGCKKIGRKTIWTVLEL